MADVEIMKEYLLLKFRESDWHGVMDAAADLRDIVAKQEGVDEQREKAKPDSAIGGPVKDAGLAGLSKELGRYDSPPRMVAGGRTKEDICRELGAETNETIGRAVAAGLATASVTQSSTTESILNAIRKDLCSLQIQLYHLSNISLNAKIQQTLHGTGKRDL